MKLIIDIPEKALDLLKNGGVDWLGAEHILDAVSKGIPYEEKSQGEWIPVSESLPNICGVYNVTKRVIDGSRCYYIADSCYFDGIGTWHDDNRINFGREYVNSIIAWMPLPEPYKENADNE